MHSPEPALRGHESNYERAVAIECMQARVRRNARPGSPGRAKVVRLLDVLRPDSRPELWYALCDALGTLDAKLEQFALDKSLRCLRDIVVASEGDRGMVRALDIATCRLAADPEENMEWFEDTLSCLSLYLGKFRPGQGMFLYVTALAQSGSEHGEYSATRILDIFYARQGMYDQACDVCDALVRSGPENARVSRDSKVVEFTAKAVLENVAGAGTAARHKGTIARVLSTLKRRESFLGLGFGSGKGENNQFRAAYVLAVDILMRRRFRPAAEMGRWIRERHPVAHGILGLDAEKIEAAIEAKTPLARHVSVAMCRSRARALDELEAMVSFAGDNGLLPREFPRSWKDGMLGRRLWDVLLEIRLYVRFRHVWEPVAIEPRIDGGKSADLEANGCYVEAYAPQGGVYQHGRFMPEERYDYGLAGSILQKPQLGHLGGRQSVLAVLCPDDVFGNPKLVRDLEEGIGSRPQPGCIVLLGERGWDLARHYVWNPRACNPITRQNRELVEAALGWPGRGEPPCSM